jgi:hypothetical protein
MIEKQKEPHSDKLFRGDRESLSQISTRQRKVIKHYGGIMAGHIVQLRTTANNKYLFVSDDQGG